MANTTVFVVETPWTRIISDEVWEAVQKREIKVVNKRLPTRYLLTGKILCPQCSRPFATGHVRGRLKCYCKHEDHRFDCRDLPVNMQTLEGLALQGLTEWIVTPQNEKYFQYSLQEAIESRADDVVAQRSRIDAEISTLDQELEAMLDTAGNLDSAAARERFNRRYDEKNEALEKLRIKSQELQLVATNIEDIEQLSLALTSDWIKENEPLRPVADYEEVYDLLNAAIHKVELIERPDVRHDVTVTYRWSIEGQVEPIEIKRTFENQVIADDKIRKREQIRALQAQIKDGEFLIANQRLEDIERQCPAFFGKFKRHSRRVASVFLASLRNPEIPLGTVAHCFEYGLSHHLDDLRGYIRGKEWNAMASLLVGNEDAHQVNVRTTNLPTMRDKLAKVQSPVLRLAIVDPANGDRDLTDQEWSALMDVIGNEKRSAFRGWLKTSDRKGLNTYFHIIRNNLRAAQIPDGMLTHSRVNRLLRHLDDQGIGMAMVSILLNIQGESDLPDFDTPLELSSPIKNWITAPKIRHEIVPGVIRKGRKRLLEERLAVRAAKNEESSGQTT